MDSNRESYDHSVRIQDQYSGGIISRVVSSVCLVYIIIMSCTIPVKAYDSSSFFALAIVSTFSMASCVIFGAPWMRFEFLISHNDNGLSVRRTLRFVRVPIACDTWSISAQDWPPIVVHEKGTVVLYSQRDRRVLLKLQRISNVSDVVSSVGALLDTQSDYDSEETSMNHATDSMNPATNEHHKTSASINGAHGDE